MKLSTHLKRFLIGGAVVASWLVGIWTHDSILRGDVSRVVDSSFEYDARSEAITFYTYYTNAKGVRVFHGWYYLIAGGSLHKSLYEDGRLREIASVPMSQVSTSGNHQ
jgi:hypothetical protein